MVNAISEEIAKGESNPQPPHPYVIPNYHERPWLPRINAHINTYHTWKNKTTGSKKQAILLQMRLHRHVRFIITAEMCSLWTPFGGIAAHLNHVAVLLSLSTLESAGFAIRYRELLIRNIADNARARISCDYFATLSKVREDTRRAITTDGARSPNQPLPKGAKQRSRKGTPTNREGKKGKSTSKGTKPNRGKKGKDNATRPSGKGHTPLSTAPPADTTRSPFWKGAR